MKIILRKLNSARIQKVLCTRGEFLIICLILPFSIFAQPQWTKIDPTNIAQFKPAKQSSVHNFGAANRAVDGIIDGTYDNRSVTHTGWGDRGAWWEVNLLNEYDISSITVYNRTDCCSERLDNFTISVSKEPFSGNYGGEIFNKESNWFQGNKTFNGAARGQYIRIFLDSNVSLSLAEVVVRGTPVPLLKNGVVVNREVGKNDNLALGKRTRQSSTYDNCSSNRGNDGVIDGNINAGSLVHTEYDQNAFWEVDLGRSFLIEEVKIHNRTDCCSDRLSNFEIFTTNEPLDQITGRVIPFASETVGFATERNKVYTGKTVGRYVRVQLKGQNHLNISEVQVFGKYVGEFTEGQTTSDVMYKVSIFRNASPIESAVKSSITTSLSEGMDFSRTVRQEDESHWSLSSTAKLTINYAIVAFELGITAEGGGRNTTEQTNTRGNNVTISSQQNTEISQNVPGGSTRYEFHKFVINQTPMTYNNNGENVSWFRINDKAAPAGDVTVMTFPNGTIPDLKATNDNWVTEFNFQKVLKEHPTCITRE